MLEDPNGERRIVVIDEGWVLVGQCTQVGDERLLEKGSVVREWGTKAGLGEIAEGGPTSSTVLDPLPTLVHVDQSRIIMEIECNEAEWVAKEK